MSEVYKALADPTRRRILSMLREREMSAGEIADHFDLAKPTLSGHFAVLREAGLVTPVKVVHGPSESIWVIDNGDFISTSITQASTRGRVFRIESSDLVGNTLQ